MKLFRTISVLALSSILIACGGGKGSKKDENKIEKEAKESADEAANEGLEKLNKGGDGDSAKADSSGN
ncbi:MAG: hypothetical protein ABEH38_01280 [Flavobacteriales bacterium]